MSKSCWQPSRFHMAGFPPWAAQLWRMETHAWAVISLTGVSTGSLVLPCCSVMPQLDAGLHCRWGSKWNGISPLCKLCLTRAHGNPKETHSLPRDGTAQLRSAQCIGTHSRFLSLTHTHPSLSISHAHCCHHSWCRCCCCCWSWNISSPPLSVSQRESIPLHSVFASQLEETRGGRTIHLLYAGKDFQGWCWVKLEYKCPHGGISIFFFCLCHGRDIFINDLDQ